MSFLGFAKAVAKVVIAIVIAIETWDKMTREWAAA